MIPTPPLAGGPLDDPAEYARLSPGAQARLVTYCRQTFMPSRRGVPRVKSTSYGLKQAFDRYVFYVTNGAFKGAMRAAGYAPLDPTAQNWAFAASYRDPALRRRQRALSGVFAPPRRKGRR